MNFYCYILSFLLLALAACSHETDEPDKPVRPRGGVAVEFNIAVPQADRATRGMPDPGIDTDEEEAWDSLLIVVAYTAKNFNDEGSIEQNPKQTVYYEVIKRSDFMKTEPVSLPDGTLLTPVLSGDGTDTNYRRLEMMLPVGKVRVFGVTYATSQLSVFNPEDSVSVKRYPYNETFHADEIGRMLISNSYGDVKYDNNPVGGYSGLSTMLSVATGTATTTDAAVENPYELEISKEHTSAYMKQYWQMVLHRLATKVDIQWDAADGFTTNKNGAVLTKVKVNGFVYDGRANLVANDKGYGRLFPWLTDETAKPLGGRWDFLNQTPVSERNGRVTHYFFPDGVRDTLQAPQIIFNVTKDRTVNNVQQPTEETQITMDMKSALKRNDYMLPAAWYKITMRIKGDKVESGVVVPK